MVDAGAPNPDDVITKLMAEDQAAVERDRLVLKVKDLEAQVSALTEVKQIVATAAKETGQKDVVERVIWAMAVQAEAERAVTRNNWRRATDSSASPRRFERVLMMQSAQDRFREHARTRRYSMPGF